MFSGDSFVIRAHREAAARTDERIFHDQKFSSLSRLRKHTEKVQSLHGTCGFYRVCCVGTIHTSPHNDVCQCQIYATTER